MKTELGCQEVVGIMECFQNLKDPRSHVNRRHLLVDVIVICICGVVAGADGATAIAEWAKSNEDCRPTFGTGTEKGAGSAGRMVPVDRV